MSTLTKNDAMSVTELAEMLKIPRFRREGMIFRRTDARKVPYVEETQYGMIPKERWEYPVREIPLQQQIAVYDHATKRSRVVEIKVDDQGSPITDAIGNITGYNPKYFYLQEQAIGEKAAHMATDKFVVRDELVYYYLMLCEYNGKNTEDNNRRRTGTPISPCFEPYDPKREIEMKREIEKQRNAAITAIGRQSEAELIALSMRYGKSVNYTDGSFMSNEDMAYILQTMISDHTDLTKDIVRADKIIRDCDKKSMETTLKVAGAVRQGVLQFSAADGVWHYCVHNGRNYAKNRVLCRKTDAHSDSYESIIEHLQSSETDMALLASCPPIKGHDRMEFADLEMVKPFEEPAEGARALTESEKCKAIREFLLENHSLSPHYRSGHAALLKFAKDNNVDLPAHLQ